MNLRLFVSILITLFVAAVHAQNTAGIEIDSRKIPLPARRSQILESIQNITGVSFSYAANQFDNIVMAELPEGEMQLETLLQKYFSITIYRSRLRVRVNGSYKSKRPGSVYQAT